MKDFLQLRRKSTRSHSRKRYCSGSREQLSEIQDLGEIEDFCELISKKLIKSLAGILTFALVCGTIATLDQNGIISMTAHFFLLILLTISVEEHNSGDQTMGMTAHLFSRLVGCHCQEPKLLTSWCIGQKTNLLVGKTISKQSGTY